MTTKPSCSISIARSATGVLVAITVALAGCQVVVSRLSDAPTVPAASTAAAGLHPAQVIANARLGPQSPQSGLVTAHIDPSIRPQNDLFRHANGTWLDQVPIPDDVSRWGIYQVMTSESELQLID